MVELLFLRAKYAIKPPLNWSGIGSRYQNRLFFCDPTGMKKKHSNSGTNGGVAIILILSSDIVHNKYKSKLEAVLYGVLLRTHPPEPHTVTFVFNNKTMAGPDARFIVPSSTKFMPLPPGVNSKPNIVPGGQNGMNTAIVSNAMSYDPALIDSTGNAKTFSPNGNEQYVNSGWLVPKGENKYFHTLHTHLLQHFKSLEASYASVDVRKGCSKVINTYQYHSVLLLFPCFNPTSKHGMCFERCCIQWCQPTL